MIDSLDHSLGVRFGCPFVRNDKDTARPCAAAQSEADLRFCLSFVGVSCSHDECSDFALPHGQKLI